jgi:Fic family protein
VSSQSRDAVLRIERLQDLRAEYQVRLQPKRMAGRLGQALDQLFERPIITVRQMEAGLGLPYRSAQRYVERLVQLGILREVTGQARNRIYCAEAILRLLEQPLDR